MTAIQPAHVEYMGYSLQGGTRKLAEEDLEFFSAPENDAYTRVFNILKGTPAFARIDKAESYTQFFDTKNVVVAYCKILETPKLPTRPSTTVEIVFDNYDLGYLLRVYDTPLTITTLLQASLNDPSGVLTFSDGYSTTIVAKTAHIADVRIFPKQL